MWIKLNAFALGDGSFAGVGNKAVAAGAATEGRGAGGVDAVADDMGSGTA
jgi:hypothetical protein